jgi:hypothetical protein
MASRRRFFQQLFGVAAASAVAIKAEDAEPPIIMHNWGLPRWTPKQWKRHQIEENLKAAKRLRGLPGNRLPS